MKIPGIKSRAVQPLARRDIAAPFRESAAEIRVAEGIDKVVQTGVDAAKNTYLIYVDSQARKADSNYKLGLQNFRETMGSQEFFSPTDLPDDVDVQRTEVINGIETARAQIPAWEVYPQLLQNHIDQSISDNESLIPESQYARNWRESVKPQAAQSVANAQIKASADQQAEIQKFSTNSINDMLAKSMWDDAAEAASIFPGSEAERQGMTAEVKSKITLGKQENELETYYGILSMEEDATQLSYINNSLTILEDKKYKGDVVDQNKRYRVIELLRRARDDFKRRATGKITIAQKEVLRDMKQARDMNNKGYRVDPEHMDELYDKAKILDLVGDPKHYDTIEGFKESYKIGQETNEFLQQNPLIQQDKITRLEDSAETGLDFLRVDHFKSASAEFQNKLRDDAMSAANSIGMVDTKPLDFKNLGASLQQRATDTNLVQDKTGRFTGYLTKDEALQFADLVGKAPVDQRISLIAQISEGLGPDAYKFYDQLDFKKAVPSFTLAGKRAAEGDKMASSMILQGDEVIEKYPSILGSASKDMGPLIDEELGSAYWHDLASRDTVKNGVYKVYATMSAEARDYSGGLDENRLEKAIEMVTGGLANVNGIKVESPMGVPGSSFERWAENIPKEYFLEYGSPKNFSSGQVSEGIREGDIELVSTFNRGEYRLLYKREGKLLYDDNGTPYTLKYDNNYPKTKPYSSFVGKNKARRFGGIL